MKKLIAILALSLSLLLCLTACGSKMPYDLSGTVSVELHAYNLDPVSHSWVLFSGNGSRLCRY